MTRRCGEEHARPGRGEERFVEREHALELERIARGGRDLREMERARWSM